MSDLFSVKVLTVSELSCTLELHCVNHNEQEVPMTAEFYANILADAYIATHMFLWPPCAVMDEEPDDFRDSHGLRWFWFYALHFIEDRETVINAHEAFGEPFDLDDLHMDEWLDVIINRLADVHEELVVTGLTSWRNDDDCHCATIELEVGEQAWIQHLAPGLEMSLVYGPEPTWDIL